MATWSAPATPTRRRGASAAAGKAALEAFRAAHPGVPELDLGAPLRTPGVTRFWACENDRAQAQAVAREVEHLLAAGEVRAERICVIAGSGWREGRLVAAALEERSVPFRFAGDAAFFQRPEVRDVLAWLRMLADPNDAAAVVRTLTRPPAGLRSVDLAKVTTIARRRKLDMISALGAALESPQLPPEARDRIQSFLRLHRAASNALEQMRADVFVRRLIERVGLRRHRLFAASPETAERLVNLSRLAELAADWSRREPRGSVRDFVRHLSAVAEAGELGGDDSDRPIPGAVLVAEPEQVKGFEFDHVYLLGLRSGAVAARHWEDAWIPDELIGEALPEPGDELTTERRLMLAHVAMTRARLALVLSWAQTRRRGGRRRRGSTGSRASSRAPTRRSTRRSCSAPPRACTRPTGCFATRCSRPRGRPARRSRRCGSTRSTTSTPRSPLPRADQAGGADPEPGAEPAPEAIDAINELLGRVASPEQRIAIEASALDEYVLGEERERGARRAQVAARREPSLDQFLPRRKGGLGLSASDIDLYRTCPLKYKFRARLRDPAGADDQPALRDPDPPGPRQVPRRGDPSQARGVEPYSAEPAGSTGCSACSRPAGGGRASAPPTTSSSTATAPSRRWPAITSSTSAPSPSRSGWSATSPSRSARTSCAGESTASTASPRAATR